VIGARRDEGALRDDVTEEQRRLGRKMGFPVGPGRFWAAPASLIAFILPVYALFAPWAAPASLIAFILPVYALFAPWLAPKWLRPIVLGMP